MNGPLCENTDSGEGTAANVSVWSCLAAPRPGGEEGRGRPPKGQCGLQPLAAADGERGGHPAISPPAPSPGDSGRVLLQGTGGQCCPQARGLSRCRAQVCTQLVSSRPQGEHHGLFVAWGSSRLGAVILRRPQAFWTILNDTVNKLLWVYISNITLISKLELSVSNSITCLQTSVKLGDIRGAKGGSLFHGNRWTGVPSSP